MRGLWIVALSAVGCGGSVATNATDAVAPNATDAVADERSAETAADGSVDGSVGFPDVVEDTFDPRADGHFDPTATPAFTPPPGHYAWAQDVSIASATAGAVIHYTIDGTNPTLESPIYTVPIRITSTTTLKANAIAPGYGGSETRVGVYTVTVCAEYPHPVTFDPPGGPLKSPATVSLHSKTYSATLCFTTDGSAPDCDPMKGGCKAGSTEYVAPIAVTTTTTIRAVTCGCYASDVTAATYTFP